MKRKYKIQGNNKKCLDCKEFRPVKYYQKRRYGFSSYCNRCMSIRTSEYNKKHITKIKKYQKKYQMEYNAKKKGLTLVK